MLAGKKQTKTNKKTFSVICFLNDNQERFVSDVHDYTRRFWPIRYHVASYKEPHNVLANRYHFAKKNVFDLSMLCLKLLTGHCCQLCQHYQYKQCKTLYCMALILTHLRTVIANLHETEVAVQR